VSQEDLTYWARFGLDPTIAFELKDSRIGYAHRMENLDNGYTRFVARVVFEKQGPHALSVFEVPSDLILRTEPFTPSRTATFGDFLKALKEGLFGGGRDDR
jgi:hypothetical protein